MLEILLYYHGQGDAIDWNDTNLSIICSLFAKQVKKGNRPNTHLNSVGYEEVSESFYQMTGIHATKLQLKNKWDKLKPDLVAWQKLLKQTGLGRNALGEEVVMDDEWWKKTKKVRLLFLLAPSLISYLFFLAMIDLIFFNITGYSRKRQVQEETIAK
jgi:hypothetical protein